MIDYDALASQFGGAAAIQPKVQVFTGIISQGVLGSPVDFMPTKSELIQSLDDLEAEAHKDAANLLLSLPGRLRYKITFANSFENEDGSLDQAGTQQVVSGFTAKGVPKYKTVKNKFAILSVFILDPHKPKHLIARINLGPVDAATVTPGQFALENLEGLVSQNLVTTDHADYGAVVSPSTTTLLNVHPEAENYVEQHVAIQAAIDAAASVGRPVSVQTATTRAEALNNLVPMRFFQGVVANGLPQDLLYVGESPNTLPGTTEITLQQAQALISQYPRERWVGNGGNPELTSGVNYLQIPGTTTPVPNRFLALAGLGSFRGTFDDIVNGNLPSSQFVWAYKTSKGEIQTFVPLSQIPIFP